jgi:hypothetical protein
MGIARLHTGDIRVTPRNARLHLDYMQVTYRSHTITCKLHTNNVQVTCEYSYLQITSGLHTDYIQLLSDYILNM